VGLAPSLAAQLTLWPFGTCAALLDASGPSGVT